MPISLLVYLAFAFGVLGFLARDELRLRLMMLAASSLYIAYYFLISDSPLWDPIITNSTLGLVNLAMIIVVVIERTTFTMSAEMTAIYRQFPLLTPGQFRRLMRAANIEKINEPTIITQRGQPLEKLYFVLDGDIEIGKGGKTMKLGGSRFVGEVAYLTRRAASATVTVLPGASILAWRHQDLVALSERSPRLTVAMLATLNQDLVIKVANSEPSFGMEG